MRAVVVVICLVAGADTVRAQATARTDTTGAIVALVTAKAGGFPLAYSVVSVPALGRERFTNDQGAVALTALPAGRTQLRIRHLGYTPIDLWVAVRANRTDTLRIQMTHIAVELNAVRVHALGVCKTPGPPRATAEPAFAAIFEQLRENADQFRLLADAYPFAYTMERISSVHYVSGELVVQSVDTLTLGTGLRWKYAPGSVVTETAYPGNRQVQFVIPTLVQFAEQSFLNSHCFANGGADTANGSAVVRVDFVADERIKPPDVDGEIYLDPATFQIRRSVLRLTHIPDQTPQISAVEVVTDFREVLPSIPIVAAITSTHVLWTDRTRPVLPDTAYETQRLMHVAFLRGKPGEDVKRP